MNVNVQGKTFPLTAADDSWIRSRVDALLDVESLRLSTVNVVVAHEKNRFQADVVVNCKYHTFKSEVEDFNFHAAVDAALGKVETQLEKLRDKIQDHKANPLRDAEPKPEDLEL